MNKQFLAFCESLKKDITRSYEEGVTMEEAEKLAAKFLDGSLQVGAALQVTDLDRRMKKAGVKAVRAAAYLDAASQGDKKPSDKLIEAVIDSDKVVADQQKLFDEAEVQVEALQNYLSVFHEAHVYYRGIAKGRFE
jgi:hypothetical protein